MITYAQQNSEEQTDAPPQAVRRPYCSSATGLGPGVLRDGRDRCRRTVGGRGSPAGQGPSQDPDGRHGGCHRGLPLGADAQCHHSRDRGPQRHPGRARPARHGVRRRHKGGRDRPGQRRHAVSRAGAPRRQRLRDRTGPCDRRGARGLQPVLGAGSQGGRPRRCRRRREGRRRRLDDRPQYRLGDRPRFWRWIP
ncbi:hypothetical protein ACVWY2_005614 [Bradyrhizobium sp. JR6.1]